MRRFLLTALKILVSAGLLYLALAKINLADLASRFDLATIGWVAAAIAVVVIQIVAGAVRWSEISAECDVSLRLMRAIRFNMIGAFFNQTLPSSIGGDAVRLMLLARSGAGWRAATYSVFVERAIGLIALAVVILVALPWSYRLIGNPAGRSALLLIELAALLGAGVFLLLGRLVGNASPLCMLYNRQPRAVQASARTEAGRSLGTRSPSCSAGGVVCRAVDQGAGFV